MTDPGDYEQSLRERIENLRALLRRDVGCSTKGTLCRLSGELDGDLYPQLWARTSVLLDLLDEYDDCGARHARRQP